MHNMKTILVDAVNTFIIKDFGIFQEMHDFLEGYSNKKIIVTNANDEEIVKFGLNKVPYEVFTLKHKPEKTDAKYFELLMKRYNLKADDLVYFEHNKDAVESAQFLGINTFHYNSETKDLEALKIFLDSSVK